MSIIAEFQQWIEIKLAPQLQTIKIVETKFALSIIVLEFHSKDTIGRGLVLKRNSFFGAKIVAVQRVNVQHVTVILHATTVLYLW